MRILEERGPPTRSIFQPIQTGKFLILENGGANLEPFLTRPIFFSSPWEVTSVEKEPKMGPTPPPPFSKLVSNPDVWGSCLYCLGPCLAHCLRALHVLEAHSSSAAFLRGRRNTFCTPMLFRVWQAQYFLHSDAVLRGRRSTLSCLAKVGRRGPPWGAVFLRGRRNSFCTPMLFRVAGAALSALRCCFARQAQYFILPCEGRPPWAAVGRRSSCVAGAILSALRRCFAWQAQRSLHSDAVSRRRHNTLYHLAKVGGLLARQAQYFLHSVIEQIDGLSRDNGKSLQWKKWA